MITLVKDGDMFRPLQITSGEGFLRSIFEQFFPAEMA